MDAQDLIYTCTVERFAGADENTLRSTYAEPEQVKCYKYGRNLFVREDTSATTVTAQSYLVLDPTIKVHDLIDGQVIRSINNFPMGFDTHEQLYECLTWRGGSDDVDV